MADEICYMLGVIAVGFAVNYTLRALPFLLFAGRDRALPGWVERLGGVISPVIIALLIVYAYSGSAWRTPWPYLAGVLTVALQVWKRNPLLSIVAGTVLYMTLLNCCGCATQTTVRDLDDAPPELVMRTDGVYMGDTRLAPNGIVKALEDAEVPKSKAIHIKMDANMNDLRASRALMALLARGGYTRSLLVTEQHGDSKNKSGDRYAGNERMERRDDVFFTVTQKGVCFGLLTPVGPDEVVQLLRKENVQTNQIIRLYRESPDAMPFVIRLESILRGANYVKVMRCWKEDKAPTAPPLSPEPRQPAPRAESPARPTAPAATRTGVRFTTESED